MLFLIHVYFTVFNLGLFAAAYDLRIEWAVIKGVSDFADGSKRATEDWQSFSSTMAASLVYNMFKSPDVTRYWPHYQKTEGIGNSYSERLDIDLISLRLFSTIFQAKPRFGLRCKRLPVRLKNRVS